MSRPTRAPDRPAPAIATSATGPAATALAAFGSRSAAKGLAAASAALVLISLLAPVVYGRDAVSATAAAASAAGPAPAPGVAATTADQGATTPSGGRSTTGPTTSGSPTESAPAAVPLKGSGTTRAISVPGTDSPGRGRTVRYVVEVEDGAGVDGGEFAALVREVLTDPRGWETQDDVHFVHVTPDQAGSSRPDVRITLASPRTVDAMCAPMLTGGEVSCRNGDRVALNTLRWTQGVDYYAGDLRRYRVYLINHEVGHAIGHGHENCPGRGKPAPVMLQQTLGLQGCTRYPWPVPGQTP